MTRRRREVGIIKSCVLGAALAVGLATAAQAGDNKLALSGSASFTTDYIFRGISQTNEGPAAQPEFDLTYGMFYAYIWGSNVDFSAVSGQNPADIEIDYGIGITPKWGNVTFNIAGLYYTYPGACEGKCGLNEFDYFELKTAATWASGQWSFSIGNWWSPEFTAESGDADAVEGSIGYAFKGKLFNFFSPSVSGLVGWQTADAKGDYTYWNAGLTLGFMEHWSADVRYWDTDATGATCAAYGTFQDNCDARVVGTLKAAF
jgi:uncharacterized protein (TIGR02001 family)